MATNLRNPRRPSRTPMAAVALVLVLALGSAAVWVTHARVPVATTEIDWWPGLNAVPTR
jgi:hypothetical protein